MKKLSIIIAFFIASLGAGAQHLFISQITSPFPGPGNSVIDSMTLSGVSMTISNLDPIVFYDTLDVYMNGNGNTTLQLLYSSFPNQDSIAAFDSINIQIPDFQFQSQSFDDGDNIVVIWPQARTPKPNQEYDSLSYHVFYLLTNGIDDPEIQPLTLYPNPSTQYISIDNKDKRMIRQVRITDSAGKEVYKNSKLDSMISIEKWSSGMYYVEIFYTNGQKRSLKVVKN